jgi:hypothetical protein
VDLAAASRHHFCLQLATAPLASHRQKVCVM